MKYRKRLLRDSDRQKVLREIFNGIGKRYWIDFPVVGTDGDHIHLLAEAAPRYSPSRLANIIKSISAKKMFERYPEFREILWGGEFWEDGFFVRTVGDEVTSEVIKQYIRRQGKDDNEGYEQLSFF